MPKGYKGNEDTLKSVGCENLTKPNKTLLLLKWPYENLRKPEIVALIARLRPEG